MMKSVEEARVSRMEEEFMNRYEHVQRGTLIQSVLVLSILCCLSLSIWMGITTVYIGALICFSVTLILVASLLLFYQLKVVVQDGRLEVSFGIGIIQWSVPIDSLETVEPVHNKWYYGWGIRITPDGWLYNVSGLEAVLFTKTNGRRFRVGTDEPIELCQAIEDAMNESQDVRKVES